MAPRSSRPPSPASRRMRRLVSTTTILLAGSAAAALSATAAPAAWRAASARPGILRSATMATRSSSGTVPGVRRAGVLVPAPSPSGARPHASPSGSKPATPAGSGRKRDPSTPGAGQQHGTSRMPPRRVSSSLFRQALTRGAVAAVAENTDLRQMVAVTGVGVGAILKVHSAYNLARGIEATATTVDAGLLRFDTPASRGITTESIVVGPIAYTKSTTSAGRWLAQRLPASTQPKQPPGAQLLRLIGSAPITETGTSKAGTTYSTSFTTTDIGLLESLGPAGTEAALRLTPPQAALLAGVSVSVRQLLITLDHLDRVVSVQMAATLVDNPAAAAAQGLPRASHGALGTMYVSMSLVYGGTLQISPPPPGQVDRSHLTGGGASK